MTTRASRHVTGGCFNKCGGIAQALKLGTGRQAIGDKIQPIDLLLVWRLDRWGRSVTDLLATLQELEHQRWRLPWGVAVGVPNIATMPGLP